MNMSEILQLPKVLCHMAASLHGGPWSEMICSTTVNAVILAVILLGAIRLFDPVRPGRRDARGRES